MALPAQRPLLHRTPSPFPGGPQVPPLASDHTRRAGPHSAMCLSPPCSYCPRPSPQYVSQPHVTVAAVVVRGEHGKVTMRQFKQKTRPSFVISRRMLCVRVTAAGCMTANAAFTIHAAGSKVMSPARASQDAPRRECKMARPLWKVDSVLLC